MPDPVKPKAKTKEDRLFDAVDQALEIAEHVFTDGLVDFQHYGLKEDDDILRKYTTARRKLKAWRRARRKA